MVSHYEYGDTRMAATFQEKNKTKKQFGHLTDKHLALGYLHFLNVQHQHW